MKKITYLLFIFLVIPACLYVALDREKIDINEFRLDSGYQEVRLSDGITSYKDIGDKSKEVIVLVHGATFGSLAYEEYVNVFVENNFRVITYDQYGRGYSDRFIRYKVLSYGKTLKELIKHCREDVILWRSLVLQLLQNMLQIIQRILVLLATSSAYYSANIPLLSIVKIPLYGDLLTRVFLVPGVLKRIEEYEDLMSKKLVNHYVGQFNVKGTEDFFKKFFLGNAMGSRLNDHSIIGKNSIPSYFAYAEDDIEIDSQLVEEAIKKYHNPIVKKYSGGHFFSSGIEKELAQEFIDNIK